MPRRSARGAGASRDGRARRRRRNIKRPGVMSTAAENARWYRRVAPILAPDPTRNRTLTRRDIPSERGRRARRDGLCGRIDAAVCAAYVRIVCADIALTARRVATASTRRGFPPRRAPRPTPGSSLAHKGFFLASPVVAGKARARREAVAASRVTGAMKITGTGTHHLSRTEPRRYCLCGYKRAIPSASRPRNTSKPRRGSSRQICVAMHARKVPM